MPIPNQSRLRDPILIELYKRGGAAKPSDIADDVASYFPNMTEAERNAELKSGGKVFYNKMQWERLYCVKHGLIDPSVRGLWTLTEEGAQAARRASELLGGNQTPTTTTKTNIENNKITLADLVTDHDSQVRSDLLDRVLGMDPYDFEQFCGQLLRVMGFRDVEVTEKSGDGGIDGYGRLKVGIVTVNAAFQCKRNQPGNNIGRPIVDGVRGATMGLYEQAIIVTTASFTKEARESSIRAGAIPVVLVDGNELVDLMIRNEMGVATHAFKMPIIDEDFFNPNDEA